MHGYENRLALSCPGLTVIFAPQGSFVRFRRGLGRGPAARGALAVALAARPGCAALGRAKSDPKTAKARRKPAAAGLGPAPRAHARPPTRPKLHAARKAGESRDETTVHSEVQVEAGAGPDETRSARGDVLHEETVGVFAIARIVANTDRSLGWWLHMARQSESDA